jgi:hypothetical protein
MKKREKPRRRFLLMGSGAFKTKEFPTELRNKVDEAIAGKSKIIVGEALGACRLQDYLKSKGYRNSS